MYSVGQEERNSSDGNDGNERYDPSVVQSPPVLFDLNLETIQDSPFLRRISDTPGLAQPELDSHLYKQPFATSSPKHTGIQESSNDPDKRELVTAQRIDVCQASLDIESSSEESTAIKELDKALRALRAIFDRENIDEKEYETELLAVEKSSQLLTTIYQEHIKKMQIEMQEIQKQAKDEKDYLEKEITQLAERELVEKIKQKECEIQRLTAALEKANYEYNKMMSKLHKKLYKKQCTEFESRQKIVTKMLNFTRERPTDKAECKETVTNLIRDAAVLRDRPATARF